MLFADIDLSARIERAECSLLTDGAAAIAAKRPDANIFVASIAGGVAIYTAEGSPLNKVGGLGFDGPIDIAALERLEHEFTTRGAPLQVELSNLADPTIAPLLSRRGYHLEGFENVLGRALPADTLPAIADDIVVALSEHDELPQWIDVVVNGFLAADTEGVPSHETFERETLESIISDMSSTDTGTRYLARRGGALAGGASMRTFEGVAQLTGAATLVEHRRRGVQSALLSTRLADAGREGCDIAVVTTQPGSKSHENVQRQGFELLYTRAILVRPAD